jgi:hypothetical protein
MARAAAVAIVAAGRGTEPISSGADQSEARGHESKRMFAQHAHDLLDEKTVVLARRLGRQVYFAQARCRVPGSIGHQLHDQRVVEIAVRLRHAYGGGDQLVERVDLGVLPLGFLLLAAEITPKLPTALRLLKALFWPTA